MLESDAPLSPTAQKLTIPTNPKVELQEVPENALEYANPVTVNNLLILYGNAKIELADRVDRLSRKIEAAELDKRKADRDLDDFETGLLRRHPAPKGVTTLKLIAAHVENAALGEALGDQLLELKSHCAECADELFKWKAQLERAHNWTKAIELAGDNITVHLSYVKAEWQHSGRRA